MSLANSNHDNNINYSAIDLFDDDVDEEQTTAEYVPYWDEQTVLETMEPSLVVKMRRLFRSFWQHFSDANSTWTPHETKVAEYQNTETPKKIQGAVKTFLHELGKPEKTWDKTLDIAALPAEEKKVAEKAKKIWQAIRSTDSVWDGVENSPDMRQKVKKIWQEFQQTDQTWEQGTKKTNTD